MSKQQIKKGVIAAQEKVVSQIVEALKNPNQDLKTAASAFLTALGKFRDKLEKADEEIFNYKGIEAGLLSHRQAIAKAIGSAKGDARKALEEERDNFIKQYNFEKIQKEIIALADELFYKMELFQKAIGLLRNQVFRIFYVLPDVDGKPVIAMVPLEDLLSSYYSASDKDIIGKLSLDKDKIKESLDKIENIDDIETHQKGIMALNQDTEILDKVYSQVIKRRKSDFIQWDDKKTKKKKEQTVPVFLAKKAKFYRILNLGDIGEGYASFYFDENKCNNLKKWKTDQKKIDYFIIHGILPVNNQSGLLQQDIQFKLSSGTTIQGAIKSIGSHLMGYKQIEFLADKIANGKAVGEKDIEKYIFTKEGQGTRNSLIAEIEKGVKKITEDAISQLFKSKSTEEKKSTKKS